VPGSGLRTLLENVCLDAGFSPRISAETGELGSLVELAAEGLGLAVVPRSALDEAKVVVVPICRPRLQRPHRTRLEPDQHLTRRARLPRPGRTTFRLHTDSLNLRAQ
jgi:DNA-binding transcriptional LysR family regulator